MIRTTSFADVDGINSGNAAPLGRVVLARCDMECPKCGGEMDKGSLVEMNYHGWILIGARKGTWIKGEELPTIKLHLMPPSTEITGERYVLDAQRCQQCGFLEWYATERA